MPGRFRRIANHVARPKLSAEERVLASCAKDSVACYEHETWDYRVALYATTHPSSDQGSSIGLAWRNLRPHQHKLPYRIVDSPSDSLIAEGEADIVAMPSTRPQYGVEGPFAAATWSADGRAQATATIHVAKPESPAEERSLLVRSQRSDNCVCCGQPAAE